MQTQQQRHLEQLFEKLAKAAGAAVVASLAACGGGGTSSPATPAPPPAPDPVATAPAPASPPAPSTETPSVKAFQSPFSATWGSPDPGSVSRAIGNTDCVVPSAVAIQSASVGAFKRYTGDCVLSYTVASARFTQLRNATSIPTDLRTEVAGALSNDFYDHFDWVLIFYDAEGVYNTTALPAGQYQSTNSWRNTPKARRLLGTAVFPNVEFIINSGAFKHELMHEWANQGALPTAEADHWGFASVGGQLGGYDPTTLTSLGGNLYHAATTSNLMWCPGASDAAKAANASKGWSTIAYGGNAIGFADLELYLMGLLPEAAVGTIKVAQNAALDAVVPGNFTATGFVDYSISQVKANIQALGRPLPNTGTAQTRYKGAVIVVTDKAKLTDAVVRSVSSQAHEMGLPSMPNTAAHPWCQSGRTWVSSNFFSATRGAATLTLGGISASIRSTAPAPLQ